MAKKKKRKHRRSKGPLKVKLKKQTVYTVGAIWLWLFAGMITLSFFVAATPLMTLRLALSERIGWTVFLLPPFLVTLSFLFFKVKSDIGKPNVPMGFAMLFFSLMGLTQSGSWGSFVWESITLNSSAEVTVLVLLALLVVSFLLLFNTSLDRMMNIVLVGSQKAFDTLLTTIEEFLSPKKALTINDKGNLKIKGTEAEKSEKELIKGPQPAIAVTPTKKNVTVAPNAKTAVSEVEKPTLKINNAMANAPTDMGMWEYPPLTLLSDGPSGKADRGDVRRNAQIIEKTLESFGITARVSEVNTGPAVTQYALEIALGTKVSKITSLSSDLALALAAPTGSVRIEAPIPGRNLVGIEIPNRGLEFVTLKRMLQSDIMRKAKSKLTVALGLDVSGAPVVTDIAKMPHVLVAGTTGSGKSVLVNSWISSLLFRTTPQEVRMILVDPKRVELTGYNGVPHLLVPVIVEPEKILSALRWATVEMDNRYKQFAEVGVRNIDGFNELSGFQAMPYIVIIIDELADLMIFAPAEVEDAICRLAQMARATGIHLVLATQRPSVDVITGLIKANVPSRIAFNVSSMVDSRTIIDMPGAEKLLGKGDMLYIPSDQSKPSRIQGTFVSDNEVKKVVDFLKNKNAPVNYTEEVINQPAHAMKKGGAGASSGANGKDQLFIDAVRLVCQHDKASASLLQRRLSVGYARAARILDQLEEAGIIGPGEGAKPRDVLIKNAEEYLAQQQQE